jgi:hypothetical protein
VAQRIEAGEVAALESYARVAAALGMRPSLGLEDPRGRSAVQVAQRDAEDFVHAAMGEVEARALAGPGRTIAIDEPYQHYQFAGRADVLAWDDEISPHREPDLFPNPEAVGAYNAKRRYLAGALAERLDLGRGWRSVTHVMACLWSSEVLHVLRLRRARRGPVPGSGDAFEAWLAYDRPPEGTTSTLMLLDLAVAFDRDAERSPRSSSGLARPRHRGYADAAGAPPGGVRQPHAAVIDPTAAGRPGVDIRGRHDPRTPVAVPAAAGPRGPIAELRNNVGILRKIGT